MRHPLGPQYDPATVFSTVIGDPIAFTDDGLLMGDGSILVRMSKGAAPGLALDDDGDRFTALMSVVGGRAIPADAIRHVEAADAHWRRGDKALANLRLILADLPRLTKPADACRLTLAAHLLDEGMAPAELMAELGFAAPDDLEKYSRDQPRVPAGHGRESGQFGDGGGSSSAFLPPVAALAPEAGAAVAAPLAGLLVFGLAMVIPTPNSGGVSEGTLPEMPDVAYHKDGPQGTLRLTTKASDGRDVFAGARRNTQGVYFDILTGQALGRDLGDTMALDKNAVRAAIDAAIAAQVKEDPERKPKAATDKPQLCPASERDKPHGDRGLAYEIEVHARVNPDDPTPPRHGYRVWDPGEGNYYFVDDCFKKHGDLVDGDMKPGDLVDAKGHEYEELFRSGIGEMVMDDLIKQAKRQQRAAEFRGVRLKWYFAQKGAADLVRKRFSAIGGLEGVVISHMPARGGR